MTKRNIFFGLLRLVRGAATGTVLLIFGIQGASASPQHDMDAVGGMRHEMQPTGFSFGESGKATKADRIVNITMGDMSFTPDSIDVTTGETIRFVVVNKSEIEHDFTIGDVETQAAHRAEMAEAVEKDEMEHGDDPNAILVDAGQQRELIWRFTRRGSLEFDRNIPGHYEAGMKGVITVHDREPGNADADAMNVPNLAGESATPASTSVVR